MQEAKIYFLQPEINPPLAICALHGDAGIAVEEKLNFSGISVLVADGDRYSSRIINHILRGFGAMRHSNVETVADAKKLLAAERFNLLITDSRFEDGQSEDLITWIRHSAKDDLRFLPVIELTCYTQFTSVTVARDSGVNCVVRKPVSPAVLYDHIILSAQTARPFIDAEAYAGPCRRFHRDDPSPGLSRRHSDHPGSSAVF